MYGYMVYGVVIWFWLVTKEACKMKVPKPKVVCGRVQGEGEGHRRNIQLVKRFI